MTIYKRFLKVDSMRGDSQLGRLPGLIPIVGFAWGVARQTNPAPGAGRPQFRDLRVQKVVDRLSPKLACWCATGRHLREVTLVLARLVGEWIDPYYCLRLRDVMIARVQSLAVPVLGAEGSVGAPGEEFWLNYGEVYWGCGAVGAVLPFLWTHGFSLPRNQSIPAQSCGSPPGPPTVTARAPTETAERYD